MLKLLFIIIVWHIDFKIIKKWIDVISFNIVSYCYNTPIYYTLCQFGLSHKYIAIKYKFFYFAHNVTTNLALSPLRFTCIAYYVPLTRLEHRQMSKKRVVCWKNSSRTIEKHQQYAYITYYDYIISIQ